MSVDLLAIAAHRDDVELTCGGTLAKMAALGYSVGIIDLTEGEMGTRGTAAERAEEAQAAARVLGVAVRENLSLPDARLEATIEAKLKLAEKIRALRPRTVILPYWEARHPDHYTASKIGYEACFLAGLKKMQLAGEPHRPFKIIYSTMYRNVPPTFVVDITDHYQRRLEAIGCYRSQFGQSSEPVPHLDKLAEELELLCRYYGSLIGVRYGEPFLVKETMRIDDLVALQVPSF